MLVLVHGLEDEVLGLDIALLVSPWPWVGLNLSVFPRKLEIAHLSISGHAGQPSYCISHVMSVWHFLREFTFKSVNLG
jgi:hypothetical protein